MKMKSMLPSVIYIYMKLPSPNFGSSTPSLMHQWNRNQSSGVMTLFTHLNIIMAMITVFPFATLAIFPAAYKHFSAPSFPQRTNKHGMHEKVREEFALDFFKRDNVGWFHSTPKHWISRYFQWYSGRKVEHNGLKDISYSMWNMYFND